LADLFEDFSKELHDAFEIRTDVLYEELLNCAESFAYDIKRYKDFHEIGVPDSPRKASYISKWIMRLRPVYCLDEFKKTPKEHQRTFLLVNELFALHVISYYLDEDIESMMTDALINILLYSLRYRAHSEDTFLLFFARLKGV